MPRPLVSGARVEIEGLERLQATMRASGRSLEDLRAANTAVAATIATAARARAPRRTGNLARSIAGTGTARAAVVRTSLIYAGVIEYGDPKRNRQAHPYLRPAMADSESVWSRFYAIDIQAKLDTVKGA